MFPEYNHLSSLSLATFLVLAPIILYLDYCSIFLSSHLFFYLYPWRIISLNRQKNFFYNGGQIFSLFYSKPSSHYKFQSEFKKSPYYSPQGHTRPVLSASVSLTLCSSSLHFAHSTPAMLAFLKNARFSPTPGPLHLPFSLPRTLFPIYFIG